MNIKLPVYYPDLAPKEKREVREEYIKKQQGLCYYCKYPLESPPPEAILKIPVTPSLYPQGFFNHPVHLQHSHETGMTEGAVHCHCNAILWEYYNE